jgi:hypothetical protein
MQCGHSDAACVSNVQKWQDPERQRRDSLAAWGGIAATKHEVLGVDEFASGERLGGAAWLTGSALAGSVYR